MMLLLMMMMKMMRVMMMMMMMVMVMVVKCPSNSCLRDTALTDALLLGLTHYYCKYKIHKDFALMIEEKSS